MNAKQISILVAILCIIGILDGIYLEINALTGVPVACPHIGAVDCAAVLDSRFADTLGIPNPILGIVFFAGELIVFYRIKSNELRLLYNAVGIAFVIYFINVERILGAICIYCTVTHLLVIILFILTLYIGMKEK